MQRYGPGLSRPSPDLNDADRAGADWTVRVPHKRASASARRGIVDPRLSEYARATRPFIVASTGLGVVSALLIIAQAWLLAYVIAAAFDGRGLAQLRLPLAGLLGVVLTRASVAWGAELLAARSCTLAKQQLRAALLRHLAAIGPTRPGAQRTGEMTTLATRGIDALDAYFSLYLPQVVLAAIVPTVVLVVVLSRDWISAAIIASTLPLIPLFMALVGATTRDKTEAQLRTLQRLASHFLDVVSGLQTLKVFGRAKLQIGVIREVGERQRRAAMSALKVTFLSSLILELLATISVALVAVAVGLRLLAGGLDLRTALLVLLLAPEAYLPLRLLGANYHASAEGLRAAEQVFAVLETPLPPRGRLVEVPDPAGSEIEIANLTVHYPGRSRPALDAVSLRIEPGEVVAVTGPSGCGKSTLLSVLLGFIAPESGAVRVGDRGLADLDPDAWRERVSWLPQRPHIFAASIGDNIRLGRPDATDDQVWGAAVAAGLAPVLPRRPQGLRTMVGEGGVGVSAGERQRVALARVLLRDAPLVLLDEPTANLDSTTEAEVVEAIRALSRDATVIVVAHRPALVALADRVVDLSPVALAAAA
jgi:ATP-binding cassette subfamily C protein CydD